AARLVSLSPAQDGGDGPVPPRRRARGAHRSAAALAARRGAAGRRAHARRGHPLLRRRRALRAARRGAASVARAAGRGRSLRARLRRQPELLVLRRADGRAVRRHPPPAAGAVRDLHARRADAAASGAGATRRRRWRRVHRAGGVERDARVARCRRRCGVVRRAALLEDRVLAGQGRRVSRRRPAHRGQSRRRRSGRPVARGAVAARRCRRHGAGRARARRRRPPRRRRRRHDHGAGARAGERPVQSRCDRRGALPTALRAAGRLMDVIFPVLLFLFIGAIAIFLCASVYKQNEERVWLTSWLWVALVLRLGAAALFATLPETRIFHEDADGYEYIGMAVARIWHGGPGVQIMPDMLQNYGYKYVVASLYYVFGQFQALPSCLNCVVGTISVFLVYHLARQC